MTVRIQEALDRDGDARPDSPHVAIAGEADEKYRDADPATHGGSIGGVTFMSRPRLRPWRPWTLRMGANETRAHGAGQEMRPRIATPPGERCCPRGL
jgi:hypothetical protein